MEEIIVTVSVAYFFIISAISAIVTVADKIKAKVGAWRVRERTLFLLSALGGSVAMYITMRVIRHKTQHRSFMIGIPMIMIAQLLILYGLSYLV